MLQTRRCSLPFLHYTRYPLPNSFNMAMSRIGTSLRRCVRYASSEAGEFRKPMINFNAKTRKSHRELETARLLGYHVSQC